MKDILSLPLNRICSLLKDRCISSYELTHAYLANIEKNKHLNAYITVAEEKALEHAKASDKRRKVGESRSLLDGIPFAVKDNICVEGMPTTCASRMLTDFRPSYTATAVDRLLGAGGVLLGKTNMDEFAMGSSSDTSYFGTVINPQDSTRSPGGSSGGGAAAVSAHLAAYTLGTDTGGSIRQPAVYCGAVGIKPTYGAVSRHGLVSLASSLDQIGVISADILGNAMVLDTIKGKDRLDPTSIDIDQSFLPNSGIARGLRVGVCIPSYISDTAKKTIQITADMLKGHGAQLSEVELFDMDALACTYIILSCAEASSNLARYDGVRYGHRAENADSINDVFTKSRSEGFGEEVKRRIMLGTYFLSAEGKDEYYKKALSARRQITNRLAEIFSNVDIILSPASGDVAPLLSERAVNAIDRYRPNAYTATANLTGIPSLAVPVYTDHSPLPCSVQLTGPMLSEKLLYSVGALIESEVSV